MTISKRRNIVCGKKSLESPKIYTNLRFRKVNVDLNSVHGLNVETDLRIVFSLKTSTLQTLSDSPVICLIHCN